MRILVPCGSGLIGSHVTDGLLRAGRRAKIALRYVIALSLRVWGGSMVKLLDPVSGPD